MRNIYVALRDQKKIMFYVNNYINWDQFNQLYTSNWLKKDVQNIDAVTQKFILASTKVTNLRRKEFRKKQKVVD